MNKMAINTYLSTIDSKKIINEEEHKDSQIQRPFNGCQRGGALGRWVKKLKVLRSTNWLLQNSHGGVKYSIGNTVNNYLITMHGVRWVLDSWDDRLVSYVISNHWSVN